MNAVSMDIGSQAWNELTASLITARPDRQRLDKLCNILTTITQFDDCVVFVYEQNTPPIDLYDSFPEGQRNIYVGDYQAGPYLLDPFYQACVDRTGEGWYRMRQLAPDHFYLSEYYLSYYKRTGLAEEIGYFCPVSETAMAVLSLMRKHDSGTFCERDLEKLAQLQALVNQTLISVWHHHKANDASSCTGKVPGSMIEQAFSLFGQDHLTQREQQIVRLLLKGHSTASVASALNISAGTVKIHRKNIYYKLGVTSQSELFVRFIDSLDAGARPD